LISQFALSTFLSRNEYSAIREKNRSDNRAVCVGVFRRSQLEVLEKVEISDDEDEDFEYKAVDDAAFIDDEDEDADEDDLAAVLASVQLSPDKTGASGGEGAGGGGAKLRAVTQVGDLKFKAHACVVRGNSLVSPATL